MGREGQQAKGQKFTLPCHHVPVNSSEKFKDSKIKAEFLDNYEGIFVEVGGWTYFT